MHIILSHNLCGHLPQQQRKLVLWPCFGQRPSPIAFVIRLQRDISFAKLNKGEFSCLKKKKFKINSSLSFSSVSVKKRLVLRKRTCFAHSHTVTGQLAQCLLTAAMSAQRSPPLDQGCSCVLCYVIRH